MCVMVAKLFFKRFTHLELGGNISLHEDYLSKENDYIIEWGGGDKRLLVRLFWLFQNGFKD